MGLLTFKERFSKEHISTVKRMLKNKKTAKRKTALIDYTNAVRDFKYSKNPR